MSNETEGRWVNLEVFVPVEIASTSIKAEQVAVKLISDRLFQARLHDCPEGDEGLQSEREPTPPWEDLD